MRSYLWPGLILAAATFVLVWAGEGLGLELEHVALLGAAIGGAVGLVPDRTPLGRVGGLLVGAVAAWLGYALRAAVLPDSSLGRAVGAVLVVGVCMLVAFLAAGRLPLWAMLLGAAAVVGVYEEDYTAAPAQFVQTSPSALTTVLLAAALGSLATVLLGGRIEEERAYERDDRRPDGDDAGGEADEAGPEGTFWEGALR